MLSIRKKILFIHVPKTAGNSIQNILKEYSDDELIDLVASKFKMEIRWGDYRFENERILSDG